MARPSGSIELPRMIQGGALRYFKAQHEDGRPMSTIWAELFEKDQFRAMDLVLKIVPKELLIDVQGNISLDTSLLPADLLKEVFSESIDRTGVEGSTQEIQGEYTVETSEGPAACRLPLTG